MSVAVRNPEDYCPICGSHLPQGGEHRCETKTLTAIDGARTRNDVRMRRPNLSDRFQDGFRFSCDEKEVEDELAVMCPACEETEILHWF